MGKSLIPFGVDDWPSGDAAVAGAAPYAIIEPGTDRTLRMNRQQFALPRVQPKDMSPEGQFSALSEHLLTLCSPWDRLSRAFLTGYFEFVRLEISHSHAEIESRLSRFGGLYRPEHLLFSAPLPLPRAHLIEPAGAAMGRADIAFRLKRGWLALLCAPSRLMPARAAKIELRLQEARADIVHFSAADLRTGYTFFSGLLGPDSMFWADEDLPVGLAFPRLRL
jgi:hypothetical protein